MQDLDDDDTQLHFHLPHSLHFLVSSRTPSPDSNHGSNDVSQDTAASLSNIEFRQYSPTPLGAQFAQKGSGKYGGKAKSYGYDKPVSYGSDFKSDRYDSLGGGLFGSKLFNRQDNSHRRDFNTPPFQSERGGGKPSRARGTNRGGRGRGTRHKTAFPGYNANANDNSDYFNSRMRNISLGTSISTPLNNRGYPYKTYYGDDREREREHKSYGRSNRSKNAQMKQKSNRPRENFFRDRDRQTKPHGRKNKGHQNRYRANSDTRHKRHNRSHAVEEITKSVLPDPPSSISSSSTTSQSEIDFQEETQSETSRNHSPSPTPSTNSARSSVASIGVKNRTTSLGSSLPEVAEDFVEVEPANSEIDDVDILEAEIEEEEEAKLKEEEPPVPIVKAEKKKVPHIQAPSSNTSSSSSTKSKRREGKKRERKSTPAAGKKSAPRSNGRRKNKKEKKRKEGNVSNSDKLEDDYWLEAARASIPPPPQKSMCTRARENCGTVCKGSRTVFTILWAYLQVILEYTWYLVVYLVRNFYEMHKHAFRAIGDHHLLFRFSFLYGFPKLTEEMLFWAPPWSPHMIWCLFASHISIWWGVVLFFVPPEVLSSSGLLQQLNPSERLVIAYVLCVLRQQNFGKPLLITVLVFLSLLSLFFGDYIVVQWIVCLVATFNIDEQNFSSDQKGNFMPPRLIHDSPSRINVEVPDHLYRYNRVKKRLK